MSASVSRPAIAARTTSSCPGRKASKPKRSRSGVRRSLRRASIGSASGGSVPTSQQHQVQRRSERASSSSRGSPSSGTTSQSPAWWEYQWPAMRSAVGRSSVPTATDTYSESGDLKEETRSALAAEATLKVAIAVRALGPAKRISVDDDVLRLGGREGPEVSAPAPALDAVADGDVAHRPAHLVGDRAAHAASLRARFGALHGGIVESPRAARRRPHDAEPVDHLR